MVYPVRNERLAEVQVALRDENVEVCVVKTRKVEIQFLLKRVTPTDDQDKGQSF